MLNQLQASEFYPLIEDLTKSNKKIVIFLDNQHKIIFLNDAAETVFNCSPKKTIGSSFDDLCMDVGLTPFIKNYQQKLTHQKLIKDVITENQTLSLVWTIQLTNINGDILYLLTATDRKEKDDELIRLETLLENMPCNVYWMDKDCIMRGCNRNVLSMLNMTREEYVGKTYEELSEIGQWPEHLAEKLKNDDLHVLSTGQPIFGVEEPPIPHANGTFLYLLTSRVPLRNNKGEVIGVAGISVDISDLKRAKAEAVKAEREAATAIQAKAEAAEDVLKLELENAEHKAELEAQTKFTKNAYSVAHDIRSPISSLLLIVKNCKEIPEDSRIALREIAISIGDIANNLLSKYGDKEIEDNAEERKPLLLSAVLMQLLTDKKYQYKELSHSFDYDFTQAGQLAFINIQQSSFKRMISNLINNAVDAFGEDKGEVVVKLEATPEKVAVTISDNGKGMPSHVIDKIMQNIEVTEGKAEGHGLGLMQVRETLARNEGKMHIESQINQGTQIKLEFPRIEAPSWIAEEICLTPDDTVIILDDDKSIHMAWDMRFEEVLKQYPQMKVIHFENCHDAIEFIESLMEKEKIFLLTDFELLKQDLNGLHVVEKTKIQRSVLVTSHYADSAVLNRASHMGTKILPKQLASEISIVMGELVAQVSVDVQSENISLKKVDAILVDDDKRFADTLIQYVFGDDEIDYFEDPQEFMKSINNYPKDTRIYLDNNYKSAGITGFTLAKELHEKGYAHLYLLTGDTFQPGTTPDYIKVIRKDDIENIRDWDN